MNKPQKKKQKKSISCNKSNSLIDRGVIINAAIVITISLCTWLLFIKVRNFTFVYWDDDVYVMGNPLIRDLSWEGIKKIFITPVSGMYNPLLFLFYAIEYKFWGLNPEPYHLVALLAHIFAIVVIYKFVYRLCGRYQTAAIVSILFAVHPMHVSVVAWVTEIKTSLFVIFYCAALIQYLNYLDYKYQNKYLLYITLLFIISVLFKPEAVTLAPILYLLDYYKGRKVGLSMLAEKIPFVAIALGFGILTLFTHSNSGDTIFKVTKNYSFTNWLLVANYGVTFYFEKLFLPFNLSNIYPYPENVALLPLKYYLSIPVIPLIALIVYKAGKFRKELIFGLLFFSITISILLRLSPTGFFQTADRYSYLPYVGLFFVFGQFYAYIKEDKLQIQWIKKKYLVMVFSVFVISCAVLSSIRTEVWTNSMSLFSDMVLKEPHNAISYNCRACAKYADLRDYQGALNDIHTALSIDSTFEGAYLNEIYMEINQKDYGNALLCCNKLLAFNPKNIEGRLNRTSIYLSTTHYFEASADADTCISLSPNDGRGYFNKGLAMLFLKDTSDGMRNMQKADKLGYLPAKQYTANYMAAR